ncbi:MAG: 30S ribosomal protein S4e [Candidatus Hadarchaeia archaeon]
MAKKGRKKHLKRLNAPKIRRISRKEEKWAINASPGPHPSVEALPLAVALRDDLEFAKNRREAQNILGKGEVVVDGKVRRDEGYPIGLMDVIGFSRTGEYWRVFPDRKGRFRFFEIDEEEANFKLGKVTEKSPYKGGRLQISLHDGKTIIGDFDGINVDDSIKISLPDLDLIDHIPLEKGHLVLVTGGNNVGMTGRIEEIRRIEGPSPDQFIISHDEEEFQVPENYLFVIGEDKSKITLPKEIE